MSDTTCDLPMPELRLEFHEDPGHGWLKVARSTIKRLGLCSQISNFSYQDGCYAYLEEDCDAAVLANALKEAGIKVVFEFITTDSDSQIRSMTRFRA